MLSGFEKVLKEIENNPRICSNCGCVETIDNIILEYKEFGFLCDDCMMKLIPDPMFD